MTAAATTTVDRPDIDISRFEAGDVDPAEFTHAAHVYVAWLYLTETTLPDAILRYSAALKQLTRNLGLESKYHETITWFFLIEIAERLSHGTTSGWHDFATRNADLLDEGSTLLSRCYSKARLTSDLARRQFILPDLIPTC